METSKQGFVEATAPYSVVSAQREDAMHGVQTSFPTVYFHTLGGLPLYAQAKPSSSQDTLAFPLSVPQPNSKQALSLLTLHVAGGVHLQQPGQKPGVTAAAVRSKSAGKHMCSYCGRDCLKPSVLEKHLRCHTGERPYPCTTCGVAFKTQSNLYKHKRTQAHARLSSDSSERDSFTSQESVQGSRDVSWSMSSLEGHFEGSSGLEKDINVLVTSSSSTTSKARVSPAAQIGHDTGWVLRKAAAVGLILTPANENQEPRNSAAQNTVHCVLNATQQKHKQGEHPAPSMPTRHLSLQRQEATFFSKQWDSRMSGGKSQNHDSTDSGFSESSEQHWSPSPSGTLHDHSMESLAESSTEEQEELRAPQSHTDSGATTGKAAKNRVSLLEKRKLEERICKLISENDALVDDKYLENVRPRKTVPSKQGSIDLPMPYTYKDSFHFEMKSSRQSIPNTDWQNSEKLVKQALYSSVPTERSLSLEHAPLVRSSSLPFNVGSSGLERASIHGSYQAESTQQSGRNRTGHAFPGDLLMRSMDQPTSHHRSLVRQKAVDGLPAADFPNLPSTEERFSSGLSGEGHSVEPTESSGGKCRRKKLPKFSYNKWYMYGEGTFRKLCNMEKGSDRNTFRAKKSANSMEQDKGQEIQSKNTGTFRETHSSGISTPDLKSDASNMDSAYNPSQVSPHLPPSGCASSEQAPSNPDASNTSFQKRNLRNLTVSTQQSITKQSNIQTSNNKNDRGVKELDLEDENSESPSSSSQGESHLPSERKKQRTEESICVPVEKTDVVSPTPCIESQEEDDTVLRQNQWLSFISDHTTEKYTNIPEQKNTVTVKDKIIDFKTSSIDHQLNQKNIRLQEYDSSPSQDNVCRLSALTKSSFLPKYQLKLPQSSDLVTSASCVTGMEQSLPSTLNQQVTEKHFSPNRQSPPTPISSTSSVIANGHVTTVTSNSAHSSAGYLSSSSEITQYKGKLTLLNSAKSDAAEDKSHDREQAGDIHIFFEIVSGDQLSVTENRQESKQEAVYSKDILQEEMKPASTSTDIQVLCATPKPQEIMSSEIQPPVSPAQTTIKEIAPSGEAPSTPLFCTSSDWGSVFHTKQHRHTDESSQRSSVHSNPSIILTQSCTNHLAQRDNAERRQDTEHSGSNLDEPNTANQEASMQKQGACVGCRDAQSLNSHICPFQEGVGQLSSVSLETCAADKPSEGVIETVKTAEQLPIYREDAPSLPATVSFPADWKVGPHSPHKYQSSSVTAQHQAHVKAPQKLLTSVEATGSFGGSSPGPVPVQQQHQFKEMASVLQNSSRATFTPIQLADSKKPSPSQCQEQKLFTYEPQHPFPSPQASLGIILPSDQTTWGQCPNVVLISQEGLDMAKKKGSRDGQQTLNMPTDSPFSSSDVKTLVPVMTEASHCNARPLQHEAKKLFLLDNLPSEEHKTDTKKSPNSADPKVTNISSDRTKSGEKPQLVIQHHVYLSPNERLKASQQEAAGTGSSVLTLQNASAAQRDKKDKDIQNAFSHCSLTEMLPQASSKTLPTVSQQMTDSGTPQFQQKLTPTANIHLSPPATTETGSRSLLVHVVGQNTGFPFHVRNLNSAHENEGITPSRTPPGHLAQACTSADTGSASSGTGKHREASPVSLSLTGTDKKLHCNSVTCTSTVTGPPLSDKPQTKAITLMASDAHCRTNPEPSGSQLTHTIAASLCTKSVVTIASNLSQDRSELQDMGHDSLGVGREEAVAASYSSKASRTLVNQPADKGVHGHVDVCIISRDPAPAGHAHGGYPSGVDPQVEHNSQVYGEPREQQRQLDGAEESETKSGGGDPDASPTPGLNQGGFTEVVGVERDTGANETRQCGSLSLQPGVTALQTATQDTAVLIGQLQPGVTALQTATQDTAVLIGQLQPGVTTLQTPMQDMAVLRSQPQPGDTTLQTPIQDTAVLRSQLQPGVTTLQTPIQDTAVLRCQLQPSMQSKAKEVNILQTPCETETCGLRKSQSGSALSHTSQSCPQANFPVPMKGDTGAQLTSRCDSSRLGLFLTPVKSVTIQSADQAEVQNHREGKEPAKPKQVLHTPLDPPAGAPHLSSCSSMGSPAQLLGERENQVGISGGRTSTSHSISKRSLQSPEKEIQLEEPRTSAPDKPGDLSRRCTQGMGRTPARPEVAGSAASQPGSRRSPLIRSQTSPAFCLMPPCRRAKGPGRTEEPPSKAAASTCEEGADSSSSDDEGKLVIELE